jgi:isomerase DpgB
VVTATAAGDLILRVDGSRPVSTATVEAVLDICERAESSYGGGVLTAHVSGVPEPGWAKGLSLGLLTTWERAVRRLERLALATVAVAAGDIGGTALDVLLAADFRIAVAGARLVVPVDGEAAWPGMALYRLARRGTAPGVRRAALLGTPIETAQLVAAGLVDVVADELVDALAAIAAGAATVSGKELAIRRQLLSDATGRSFEDALGAHLAACDRTLHRGTGS